VIRAWLASAGDAVEWPGGDALPPVPHPLSEDAHEEDRVRARPVAAVVIGAMLVVVGAGVGVWFAAPRGGASAMSSPSLSIAPADPFALPTPREQRRAEQRARRERWEWTSSAHDRVRRPLSLAIDAYLGAQR
jgi:hypothetical protein